MNLTVTDIAKDIQVSDRTVRDWIVRGLIRAVRLPGGGYRVRQEEWERVKQSWEDEEPERTSGVTKTGHIMSLGPRTANRDGFQLAQKHLTKQKDSSLNG
ncbi:excisionase family DNA-binding protein [Terasakiella pusilla]|uniref:excisionase family DNA-binding protein n=1 Tax=Terasakiella pusilla TaxID=64973 RepID=UPI003AA7F0D1